MLSHKGCSLIPLQSQAQPPNPSGSRESRAPELGRGSWPRQCHSMPWEFCSRSAARRRLPLLKNPSCGEGRETKPRCYPRSSPLVGEQLGADPGYHLYGKGDFRGVFGGCEGLVGRWTRSRRVPPRMESPKLPQKVRPEGCSPSRAPGRAGPGAGDLRRCFPG